MSSKDKNTFRAITLESLKAYLFMFCVFILIGWLTNASVNIIYSALFALLVTGGIAIPILLALKITIPEINKETKEERLKVFKEHHMALKLMASLTVSVSLFFILFWLIVPFSSLVFWEVLAGSICIAFIFAGVSTLVVRFIIQLEKPPFQNWND